MNRISRKHVQGLSLIELMIALLIGLILLMGLIQVFAASRTAYQLSEGLARVQENGRFAMDYLQRDIRMAGHYGCVNDQGRLQTNGALISHLIGTENPLTATDNSLNFNISIQGYEANNSAPTDTVNVAGATAGFVPALPGYLSGLNPVPRAGSDVIMLRFLSANGVPVTGVAGSQVTVDAGKWSVLTDEGVAAPTLFGASDCSFTDIFRGTVTGGGAITATAGGLNTTATDFSGRYTASPAGQSMVYRANAIAYYVGVNIRGVPSLYRARFSSAAAPIPEELVEGIENLQLLYGQDESTDVNSLSGNIGVQNTAAVVDPTGGVANQDSWRRVGQVQVGVLARSPDSASAPPPVDARRALGVIYTLPNDGRYRISYEATIALRNRLYGQ